MKARTILATTTLFGLVAVAGCTTPASTEMTEGPTQSTESELVLSNGPGRLFLGSFDGGHVTVVDIATRSIVKVISTGSELSRIALTPDKKTLFATAKEPAGLTGWRGVVHRIDTATLADTAGTRAVGASLESIAVMSNGDVYVGDQSRVIFPIDPSSLAPKTSTLYPNADPTTLFADDDMTLWSGGWGDLLTHFNVGRRNYGSVELVKPQKFVGDGTSSFFGMGKLANGTYVAANTGTDRVVLFRMPGNQFVDGFSVGDGPWAARVAPGKNFAYVPILREHRVQVVETSADGLSAWLGPSITTCSFPSDVTFDPWGNAFVSCTDSVSIIDTATHTRGETFSLNASQYEIAWAPSPKQRR